MHMASAAGMVAPFLLVLVPMAISEPPWLVSEGRTEESAPLGVSSLLQQQEAETFPTSSSESSAGPSAVGTRTNASSRPGDVDPAPLHMGKVGTTATSRLKSIVRSTYTRGSPVHRPAKRAWAAHKRTKEPGPLSSLQLQPKNTTNPEQFLGEVLDLEKAQAGTWRLTSSANAVWGQYYGNTYKAPFKVGAVMDEETEESHTVARNPPKKSLQWKGGGGAEAQWKVLPALDSGTPAKEYFLIPQGEDYHMFQMVVTESGFFSAGKKTFHKIDTAGSSKFLECDDANCKVEGTLVAEITKKTDDPWKPFAVTLLTDDAKWSDDFGPLVLAAAILGKGPNNK
mmetsp:Transcript_16076/g.40299  ORF Transcript_16076/g.40299 Transcript_16076/m.40299 type:complete len:340 (+) Transcript_16076:104-1123(+)